MGWRQYGSSGVCVCVRPETVIGEKGEVRARAKSSQVKSWEDEEVARCTEALIPKDP